MTRRSLAYALAVMTATGAGALLLYVLVFLPALLAAN